MYIRILGVKLIIILQKHFGKKKKTKHPITDPITKLKILLRKLAVYISSLIIFSQFCGEIQKLDGAQGYCNICHVKMTEKHDFSETKIIEPGSLYIES